MMKISKNRVAWKKNLQEKVIAQFNLHNLCDCTSDEGILVVQQALLLRWRSGVANKQTWEGSST